MQRSTNARSVLLQINEAVADIHRQRFHGKPMLRIRRIDAPMEGGDVEIALITPDGPMAFSILADGSFTPLSYWSETQI